MITRFLFTLCLLLQAAVAGPSQQLLLAQVPAPSSGIAVNGAAKNSAFNANASVSITPASSEMLVAIACEYGASVNNGTMSDNLSSAGWTKVTSDVETSSGGIGISIWYLANASPSITTVTFTRSTGTSYNTLIVHRVSGVSTSAPFTSGESATAKSAGATSLATGAVSNATANSIYFAGVVTGSGNNPCTMTINSSGTTGTWNLYNSTNSQELDAFNNMPLSVPNIIVTSTASRGHGWAFESSLRCTAAVAIFH